jgi:hypothetical protein
MWGATMRDLFEQARLPSLLLYYGTRYVLTSMTVIEFLSFVGSNLAPLARGTALVRDCSHRS